MKYSVNIDQCRAVEWGLGPAEAAMVDLLSVMGAISENNEVLDVDGVSFIEIKMQQPIQYMPLFFSDSDQVLRVLCCLVEKGIFKMKLENGKVFMYPTELYFKWNNTDS